ncbi:hypothetical protein FIV07_06640 [Mycobacterium sp. THAF192]|nr:hypothetical protein FIV07_06640 [Mycobacterium sp. THAF192]
MRGASPHSLRAVAFRMACWEQSLASRTPERFAGVAIQTRFLKLH